MNIIDNFIVDKMLRYAQYEQPKSIQMTPEQRKLMYDQLLANYMEYAKEERAQGRSPKTLNDWMEELAPTARRAQLRRIVAQAVLRPDSGPEEAREALQGPLSDYYKDMDLDIDVSGEEAELTEDAQGTMDLYVNELIQNNYNILGQWTPAELHTLMERSVPLPFGLDGTVQATYEQPVKEYVDPLRDEIYVDTEEISYETAWEASVSLIRIGPMNEQDTSAEVTYEVQQVLADIEEPVPY